MLHALGRHTDALADCYAAVSLDRGYLRAYQRRADILAAVGDHVSAAQVPWSLFGSLLTDHDLT